MSLNIHFCEKGGIIWRRLAWKILLVCCPAVAIFMIPSVKAQNLRFVVFAEGKHGYIDQNGSVVIPITLNQTYVNSFNEGLAMFSVAANPQQKIPYVDQRGKTRIRPEEKWGFIKEDGEIAIPPQFDKVMDFSEGLAAIAFDTDETEPVCLGCDPKQVWGFIDKQGSLALSPQFHNVRSFSEGLAAVQNKEGRWGFVNKNGELVIPFLFENAHSFHEGLAVANTRNNKIGFIDPKGNFVIKPQFSEANNFSNGLAAVRTGGKLVSEGSYFTGSLGGKWSYIDKSGKIRFRLPSDIEYAYEFSEGLAVVGKNGGDCGYINTDGKLLTKLNYGLCGEFSEGLANVSSNGRWSYIDKKGRLAFKAPTEYFMTYPFKNGLARIDVGPVGPDQRFGYINKQGNEIWKPLPAIISK